MKCDVVVGSVAIILVLHGAVLLGADEVRKIQDNSFLLEEAYNQEDGVVQHIQTFQYLEGGDWAYTFTQEWPVPTQMHQFSYTIPYLRLDEGEPETGFGDVLLNYRYQAVLRSPVAFSPRASIILPTGDHEEGLGSDAWGMQGNLPLSIELTEQTGYALEPRRHFHPRCQGPGWIGSRHDRLQLWSELHLHRERRSESDARTGRGAPNETVVEGGSIEPENSFFINPGLRYAIDVESGLQIVPGLSFPIGIGPSEGDFGVFLYLSFEHPLFKL